MPKDPFSSEKDAAEEIERRRRLFEQNWEGPSVRRIREEIEAVPSEWRADYLRELLYIEFEFLLRDGLEPSLGEYIDEFPENESIVDEVVKAVSGYTVFHPQTIGPYSLIKEIGRGGMGVVYRAKHNLLDKQVAIKVIKKDYVNNEEAVHRFLTEIKSLGRLSHPNIVMATDAGIGADGAPYLVMELIDGCNLARWSRQHVLKKTFASGKPLKFSHLIPACEIIRNAAQGLQAIHEAGLVHRDIKPENLILQVDGTVKILDLGLAKLRQHFIEESEDFEPRTRRGFLLGTLGYMAPEQLYSPSQVDTKADIYSLGGTFFHLLFGRSPAEKEHGETRYAIPKKIRSILDRALAADPAVRYQEPIELARDLDVFLAQTKKTNRLVFLVFACFIVLASTFFLFFSFPPVSELEAEIKESPLTIHGMPVETASIVPVETVSDIKNNAAVTELEKTQEQIRKGLSEIADAVELRRSGNIEQARVLLLDLEKQWLAESEAHEVSRLNKDAAAFSGRILLPYVFSALGDCDFFSGIASGTSRSRKADRVAKWYEDALSLLSTDNDDFQELFEAELTCKSSIMDAIRNEQEQTPESFESTKKRFAGSWTQIRDRRLQLFHQLASAVNVFRIDDKPLRNFVEQFEWSTEPELFTRESRELRLFALEFLITRDRHETGGEKLTEDLNFLDRILFSSYAEPGDCVYLRRYFDLAISYCRSNDYSRLVRYLLRLRPQNTVGFRIVIPENATIALFYFSPIRDVNGFAIYYPKDRQRAKRFEFSKNRNEVKEAIEHDISLPLDEELVALICKDQAEGIPIILSWDDSSCWPPFPRRDAFRNEDWPFEESLSLEKLLGQLK